MKIKSLYIKGFRAFGEVHIDDFDQHMNLFVGVNGSGKSSVLDAIAYLMSWFVRRMQSLNKRGNDIKLDDISLASDGNALLKLILEDGQSWQIYRGKSVNKNDKTDLSEMNCLLKQYSESLLKNPRHSVPVVVHYKVGRAVNDIPLKIRKGNSCNCPTDAYHNALEGSASFRDFFSWFREQEDVENELIRDDRNYRDPNLEAIREAMKKIFPEYSEMRVKRHPQSLIIRKQEQEMKLNQLSDGEKCYISLVCDLTRRLALANSGRCVLEGTGIVLIDEVDLHLHPEWQRTVLSKLISTFPNCQFFVTTHSPLVASDSERATFKIENGDVKRVHSYGLDAERVLTDTFSVSILKSETVQKLIDEAYDAIRNNNDDEYNRLLIELKGKLGESNDDILRLNLERCRWNKKSN